EDTLLRLGALEHRGKRYGAGVVLRDALGELHENPPDWCLAPGAGHHPDRGALGHEDPARHGAAFDHGGERDTTSVVDHGGTEAGERSAGVVEEIGRAHV